MNLPSLPFTRKSSRAKNAPRFNPHRYWLFFLTVFTLVLTVEFIYFSWFFLHTTEQLDATVTPNETTNADKIRTMQHRLDLVDAAIQARIGKPSNQ